MIDGIYGLLKICSLTQSGWKLISNEIIKMSLCLFTTTGEVVILKYFVIHSKITILVPRLFNFIYFNTINFDFIYFDLISIVHLINIKLCWFCFTILEQHAKRKRVKMNMIPPSQRTPPPWNVYPIGNKIGLVVWIYNL